MKDFQHEQLFTELTPAEAAIIEGGKRITLHKVECIKANADAGPNSDDLFIKLGGERVWGPNSIDDGLSANLNNIGRDFGSSIRVEFRDQDTGNPDDYLGSITASKVGRNQTSILEGSGSKYKLFYSVT